MTANKNLLRMKFARVIEAYAARTGCSLDEALDRFYRSQTYELMRDGVSDMHCMSDEYLVDEILDESGELSGVCDVVGDGRRVQAHDDTKGGPAGNV